MLYLFIIITIIVCIYLYDAFFRDDLFNTKQTEQINKLLKNVQGFKKFKTDGYGYFYRSGNFSELHNQLVSDYLNKNEIKYKLRKDCMVIHFKVKKSSLKKFYELRPDKTQT